MFLQWGLWLMTGRGFVVGLASFAGWQLRLALQFGQTTFSFWSAIWWRKAENVWPHCGHNASIVSLLPPAFAAITPPCPLCSILSENQLQ
jgi:hypothetical protein